AQEMKRRAIRLTLLATLAIASVANAQRASAPPAWPAITAEMKPWTRWWWQGSAVNPAELTANLDKYRRVGLGGVEVTPIYGVKGAEKENISYLSHEWVQMIEYTVAEARR